LVKKAKKRNPMLNLFDKPKTNAGEQDKLEWLQLSRTPNVGPITFYKLIEKYQTASNALDALPELAKKGGRKKPLVAPNIKDVEQEYNALLKLGGDMVCAGEDAYPLSLANIDDAPPIISYIGDIKHAHCPCLGIVGARNASLNGRKFTHTLAQELGQAGQVIASGLARGIDTAAHEGALATGTIAVVAGGIDVVYPRENQKLYMRPRAGDCRKPPRH
jgi:DNA processing protein